MKLKKTQLIFQRDEELGKAKRRTSIKLAIKQQQTILKKSLNEILCEEYQTQTTFKECLIQGIPTKAN